MRRSLRAAVHATLVAAVAALLVATVLGFTGRWYWTYDLLAAFRVQYALGFGSLALVALLLRTRITLALALVGLAVNAALVVPLYLPPSNTGAKASANDTRMRPTLDLLVLNVYTNNTRRSDVADYIEHNEPDLVLLLEVDRRWVDALDELAPSYRALAAEPRTDNFGMMALASHGFGDATNASASVVHLLPDESDLPSIDTRLEWAGGEIAILSVHTLPPMSTGRWAVLEAQMQAMVAWAGEQRSAVVVGDLNATPWSWPFRTLTKGSVLLNSQPGFGVQPTWPARFPAVLQIPIDHVLHDASLVTVERHVGPNLGSDHLPVHVTIVRAAATR